MALLEAVPNVATRTRRIIYGLCALGDALAPLVGLLLGRPLAGKSMVGFDRGALDYSGWWTDDRVAPLSNHIPVSITEREFLSRCSDIAQAVAEGLSEGLVRAALHQLGAAPDVIKDERSIQLLSRFAANVRGAVTRGVSVRDVVASGTEVPSETPHLRALIHLRNLSDHSIGRGKKRRILDEALRVFGVSPGSTRAGWGLALDAVYDGVAGELEELVFILNRLRPSALA
jgi:hypothetical protein